MDKLKSISAANKLIVEVFNDILVLEEKSLKSGAFNNISISEMHTVEAIGMYKQLSTSEVANILQITVGTLTVAANKLVKKGLVERIKNENDRRVVKLGLTSRGRILYRMHEKFHRDIVKAAIHNLSNEEEKALVKALSNLHEYFIGISN